MADGRRSNRKSDAGLVRQNRNKEANLTAQRAGCSLMNHVVRRENGASDFNGNPLPEGHDHFGVAHAGSGTIQNEKLSFEAELGSKKW